MKRLDDGRRIFDSEAKALKAQLVQLRDHGVMSGAQRYGDDHWVLLFDVSPGDYA
jgi:hypothetical protein